MAVFCLSVFSYIFFFFFVVGERAWPNEEGYSLLHFIMKNNIQISDRPRRGTLLARQPPRLAPRIAPRFPMVSDVVQLEN